MDRLTYDRPGSKAVLRWPGLAVPILLVWIPVWPTAATASEAGVELLPVVLNEADTGPSAVLAVPSGADTTGLSAVVVQPASHGPLAEVGARRLTTHLARSGWAVLELASPAQWPDFQEAGAGVTEAYVWLADTPRVDAGRVGLIGLGNGAHSVAVAAGRVGDPAFAVAVSGGAAPSGSFDPTSWWWTLDAPLLFVFGDAEPTLDLALARIEEAVRPEGIRVEVELLAGLDSALAVSAAATPLADAALARIVAWMRRAVEDGGG